MNIITLTLNPAIDVHCKTESFAPFHENLADIVSRDLGGKGINISRALYQNDVSSTPLILVGEESKQSFEDGLKGQLPDPLFFTAKGGVRENITLHSKEGETRISFRGFEAPADILDLLVQYFSFPLDQTIVTFTGSMPAGIKKEDAIQFLLTLKEKGAKLVIDSKSITLEELLLIKPWLIKPNEEEIQAYLGREIDFDGLKEEARHLHEAGIDQVVISLGGDGALLSCEEGLYRASVPSVAVKSTIGAGDSSIAGFLAAYQKNPSAKPEELLRSAVAFGTAACLSEGTLPPVASDVADIYQKIDVISLS